jgi:hypothetical protein
LSFSRSLSLASAPLQPVIRILTECPGTLNSSRECRGTVTHLRYVNVESKMSVRPGGTHGPGCETRPGTSPLSENKNESAGSRGTPRHTHARTSASISRPPGHPASASSRGS